MSKGITVLDRYLKEISQIPVLTPEEELKLALKGTDEAIQKLVAANTRFVVAVAKQYRGNGLDFVDLISHGNLGLMVAAERFDATRGFKFITYAVWWIRQSILNALATQSRTIRLPVNLQGSYRKINNTIRFLEQKSFREPTIEEIAEITEIDIPEISQILSKAQKIQSLDLPVREMFPDGRLADTIACEGELPDAGLNKQALRETILEQLNTLKPHESEIIKLYFGLEGVSYTLEEIGERLELTRERVRQIKEKALKRLRHPSRASNLRE